MPKTLLRWSTLALMLVLAAGCAATETVPVTGRERPALQYTETEMARMGDMVYADFLAKHTVVDEGPEAEMVKRIGAKIAAVTGLDYEWEFRLLESPSPNAFCLPGGKVAVFTGLLPIAQNEDALAFVMGHEIAHATLQHGNERISSEPGIIRRALRLPVNMVIDAWGRLLPRTRKIAVDGLGGKHIFGLFRPDEQTQEREADLVGLKYAFEAGYDPAEAPKFWKRMGAAADEDIRDSLDSHPASTERAEILEQLIADYEKKHPGELKKRREAAAAAKAKPAPPAKK